jgi:hypothetical protein
MTNELEKQFTSVCSTESHLQQYECSMMMFNKFQLNYITIDGCLWQEIKYLHSLGIETIGSCCGHHANSPLGSAYIQVKTECEQKMIDLGYTKHLNNFGLVWFEPKTVIKKAGTNDR